VAWIPPIVERVAKEWRRVPCFLVDRRRALFGQPPSLTCWLDANPAVAQSIKWQFQYVPVPTPDYEVPPSAKRAWPDWSQQERQELVDSFENTWRWLQRRVPPPFTALAETIPYPPVNVVDTSTPTLSPWVKVDPAWARDLYVRWIGLNLAVELGRHVPWSVASYTAEQLRALFDSDSFLSVDGQGYYTVCAGDPGHLNYVKRTSNRGGSLIAPPRVTLKFLHQANLMGATRGETIARLLDWARDNLVHFYGNADYRTMEQHWQYRGLPPITHIIGGTTSTATNPPQFGHWTAGCHGTTGFLRNVLRAVNIPVHIIRVCGHSQVHFLTEDTYLDHGDNPYNLGFKASGLPASDLLLTRSIYESWFGTTQDNHGDPAVDPYCADIGRRARELAPP
jgi:hypothetical protein